jgi:hypothetical protein
MFSDRFDVIISKIIFLKIKKIYFNIFLSKKHFKTITVITIPNEPFVIAHEREGYY